MSKYVLMKNILFVEHVVSIISSMLRNCQGSQRQRLLAKFTENDLEKVDRLLELHFKYMDRVDKTEKEMEVSAAIERKRYRKVFFESLRIYIYFRVYGFEDKFLLIYYKYVITINFLVFSLKILFNCKVCFKEACLLLAGIL